CWHDDRVVPLGQVCGRVVVLGRRAWEAMLKVDEPGRRLLGIREVPVGVDGVARSAVDRERRPLHPHAAARRNPTALINVGRASGWASSELASVEGSEFSTGATTSATDGDTAPGSTSRRA